MRARRDRWFGLLGLLLVLTLAAAACSDAGSEGGDGGDGETGGGTTTGSEALPGEGSRSASP